MSLRHRPVHAVRAFAQAQRTPADRRVRVERREPGGETQTFCHRHHEESQGRLEDEAQVPALNGGQTSYHQRDAGERLGGRGHGLSLTHPGGVRRLHQRAHPAGSLPPPRAPERSPPLDRTPRPKSHSYHFIFILKFLKDLCSLDTSRPVRCVLYIN